MCTHNKNLNANYTMYKFVILMLEINNDIVNLLLVDDHFEYHLCYFSDKLMNKTCFNDKTVDRKLVPYYLISIYFTSFINFPHCDYSLEYIYLKQEFDTNNNFTIGKPICRERN